MKYSRPRPRPQRLLPCLRLRPRRSQRPNRLRSLRRSLRPNPRHTAARIIPLRPQAFCRKGIILAAVCRGFGRRLRRRLRSRFGRWLRRGRRRRHGSRRCGRGRGRLYFNRFHRRIRIDYAAGSHQQRQRYTKQQCILVYFPVFHDIIVTHMPPRLQ